MKILQVVTSMHIGGAEHLVVQIAPMLQQRGYDCDVCLFNGTETPFKLQLLHAGVTVHDLSYDAKYYSLSKIRELRKAMKGYDIVHCHLTATQLFAAIANIGQNCKLVTTEHSANNRRRGKWWFKPFDKWVYNQFDKVISISTQTETNLRQYLGIVKPDFKTIFNGIEIDKFHNADVLPELEHNGKIVTVMVAAFRPEKDQETLIKAMANLSEKHELWIVGGGNDSRKQLFEELAASLHITDRVRFLGIRYDVPQILKSADVVVMSSHWEGLSLSSIEGMASGRPFIASDVDGLREITQGYGILFPEGDYMALANEIKRLSEDKEFYEAVTAKCWERAQQFDIRKMVDGYARVYDELMAQK